jgi:hypothetical protein
MIPEGIVQTNTQRRQETYLTRKNESLNDVAQRRDQKIVMLEMWLRRRWSESTKGNEKNHLNKSKQAENTALRVLRFNPLFIQFSFPISLRPSKTFSEIKGYYRFIALCRRFFALKIGENRFLDHLG